MVNKSILCLGWCDADDVMNYGQILQACALMSILRSISDYNITYISYLSRKFNERLRYYIKHYNPLFGHMNGYLKTKKTINKFIRENNIYFRQIMDVKELLSLSHGKGILICGSDQIWHPQNFDDKYFLNFGDENAKRISYAASLPKTGIEPQFKKEYAGISKAIKTIDCISVRERGSVEFIKLLSGKDAVDVLDPTYLISKTIWDQHIEPIPINGKYIFVYIPNGMDLNVVNFTELIKKRAGIKRVVVMITRGKNLFTNSENLKYISAGQFLYLIKNAAYIITSSFHAVVFSTIFHKEFWCYDVPNEYRGEDIRLSELLKLVQLSSRMIDSKILQSSEIDYDKIDSIIESKRVQSLNFLSRAIYREC